MKDFFGNDIKVGDTVAFMTIGYRSLALGTVVKLTPKTVFIKYTTHYNSEREVKQEPNQVIVKT